MARYRHNLPQLNNTLLVCDGGMEAMTRQLRELSIIGGCCGTDHRHVKAMCEAVAG